MLSLGTACSAGDGGLFPIVYCTVVVHKGMNIPSPCHILRALNGLLGLRNEKGENLAKMQDPGWAG
jgi:hypothetical protein